MRNVKIAIVSFLATVCVVWWHCSCGAPMERWFVPSFCTWAVPWFFFVSGFFFRNSFDRRGGIDLLKSKIRSLLIPYLMWSLIGLLICGFKVGYGSFIETFAASPYVFHPKGNPALWYVRTLMIFVLIGTPLMAFLRGWRKYAVILWGGAFLTLVFVFRKVGVVLGPGSSSMYFAAGVVLGPIATNFDRNVSRKWKILVGSVCLLGACIMRWYWFALGFDMWHGGGTLIANMSTVFLIGAFWCIVEQIPQKMCSNPVVTEVTGLASFVYFVHFPCNIALLRSVKMLGMDRFYIFFIFSLPILYFFVAWCTRKFSGLYDILSGGR